MIIQLLDRYTVANTKSGSINKLSLKVSGITDADGINHMCSFETVFGNFDKTVAIKVLSKSELLLFNLCDY